MSNKEIVICTSAISMGRLIQRLMGATFDKPWRITVEQIDRVARTDQEAVLRGKERIIAEFTGHDPSEVHEEMLARHYGTERVELGSGKYLTRPARRTRTGPNPLSPTEMTDHIRWVESFAARDLALELR